MTIKEKLIKKINNLPDSKIEEVYKLLKSLSESKSKKKILKTYEPAGKYDNADIRNFSSKSDAFDFWNNEDEDIYQDYLTRDKK